MIQQRDPGDESDARPLTPEAVDRYLRCLLVGHRQWIRRPTFRTWLNELVGFELIPAEIVW